MKIRPVVFALAVVLGTVGSLVFLIPSEALRLALGAAMFALLIIFAWHHPVDDRPTFETRATRATREAEAAEQKAA